MDDKIDISYRGLEKLTGERRDMPELGQDVYTMTPNYEALARVLNVRGAVGRGALLRFETWMIAALGYAPATAKRKRRLVWGCMCDHSEAPWDKVLFGHLGEKCRGANAPSYVNEIKRALCDYAEWQLEDPGSEDDIRKGREILEHLKIDITDVEARIALRAAEAGRRTRAASKKATQPRALPAPVEPSLPPPSTAAPSITPESLKEKVWLSYAETAVYTGYSVGHLRNSVSSGSIPVDGKPGARKFRRAMIDFWMADRDAAMRLYWQERKALRGD